MKTQLYTLTGEAPVALQVDNEPCVSEPSCAIGTGGTWNRTARIEPSRTIKGL